MARAPGPKKSSGKNGTTASAFEQAALRAGLSPCTGTSAMSARYQSGVALRPGYRHTASVDLDAAFRASESRSARWDHGLGIAKPGGDEFALWVEPHPASSGREVDRMIEKLNWLKAKLQRSEFAGLRALRDQAVACTGMPYRWLAQTGDICVLPNSRDALRLASNGLGRPCRHLVLP